VWNLVFATGLFLQSTANEKEKVVLLRTINLLPTWQSDMDDFIQFLPWLAYLSCFQFPERPLLAKQKLKH
jgi:hypothetical protein